MPEELVPGSPQPEAPAKPTVAPVALEQYFQSVKEPFRETRDGMARDSKGVNGAAILFFIFSLIPLFPFVASMLVWRYFGSTIISVRVIHFHLGSFWFWWVTLFIVSLAALLVAVKCSGVIAEEKKKWLSPAQMRFAYCYAVVDEIRKYKTNQLGRHIDTALELFDETARYQFSRTTVPLDIYPGHHPRRELWIYQEQAGIQDALGDCPTWYRVRPETETILKAFGEFVPKLRDRLKDRRDLAIIETALTDLASYQYLEIPELSDSKSEKRFDEEMQSLLNFAQQVVSLPPYRSEQEKTTSKQKFSDKIFETLSMVTAPFRHENPLVAFLFWFVFLSILFCGGVFGWLRIFQVKIDSTIITTLVAGPILGAVTAVTIPRVGRRKEGN
jgi:hypothetical protein